MNDTASTRLLIEYVTSIEVSGIETVRLPAPCAHYLPNRRRYSDAHRLRHRDALSDGHSVVERVRHPVVCGTCESRS